MTTPSVANIASSMPPSAAGRAGARQAEASGNPFQQMLSEEIAGKGQAGNSQADRTDTQTSAAADKTNTPAAGDASKNQAAADKDESDTETATLSPELAAMIAGLLQRQSGTGEAAPAEVDTEAADPLALLGKALGRQDGEKDAQADLSESGDSKLNAARDRTAAQADADLDLQAALSRQGTADVAGEEGAPTEFSSTLQQLNQAAQAGAARNAQAVPHHIAPRVGSSGWDQAIAQRVSWMVSGAEQSASLTLNPPELGPLQVVLNVSNSHANATFVAPHAEVRQALEAALPKLREMLGEAGIQLDQASVNQGTPQQQGDFARSSGQGQGSHAGGREGESALADEPPPARRVIAGGNGLVDTFA